MVSFSSVVTAFNYDIFPNITDSVAFMYVFRAEYLTLDTKTFFFFYYSYTVASIANCFIVNLENVFILVPFFTAVDSLSFSSTYCPRVYKNTLSAFSREYIFCSNISDEKTAIIFLYVS